MAAWHTLYWQESCHTGLAAESLAHVNATCILAIPAMNAALETVADAVRRLTVRLPTPHSMSKREFGLMLAMRAVMSCDVHSHSLL